MEDLKHSLLCDLAAIGIQTDFVLKIKGYSKTYFGNYQRRKDVDIVSLYVFSDSMETVMYSYKHLLFYLIHECCHMMQYRNKNYVRKKGLMHDAEFYALLNKYHDIAKSLLLLREVKAGAERKK